MLASLRPAAASWPRVRKNGVPERMSIPRRAARSASATGVGIRPLPRCGVRIAIGPSLVRQVGERVEGGLALATRSEQARLPAGDPGLVAEQEPAHQRHSRVLAHHRECLLQVLGLLRVRDAEVVVRRPGLVAVLGDPHVLVAVEPGQQAGQQAEVPEPDRRGALRPGPRRLLRAPVVRMVVVDVEVAQAVLVQRGQERQRCDRRPAAPRLVVAVRFGFLPFSQRGVPQISKITWILCACAFLTNVSYWLQSYAGSFGSAGWAGRFGAICGHGMSIRSTWTCSVFRSGKVVSGAAIGCTGS